MRTWSVILVAEIFVCVLSADSKAEQLDIPQLNWQPRSDWINVKTGVTPAAIGDGTMDDTAALQTALDKAREGGTVYLPSGTYRITETLVFRGRGQGAAIIGTGRNTRLIWDGSEGGRMFWSDGMSYTRYVGLTWDGHGKAAIGFDHAAQTGFETELQHRDEAFRNFTGYGIRIGNQQKYASAEILYHNCMFENCGTALGFLTFNDYDNSVDGCEFRNCGTGVLAHKSNFYARNCHFENSRVADFAINPEHGCSIRRCTSVGSKCFVFDDNAISPLTIQDCHVARWTDPDGAVTLSNPTLMFDCVFSEPPSDRPPVKLLVPKVKLLLSNNEPAPLERLVQAPSTNQVFVIPSGRTGGAVTSAGEHFLQEVEDVSGKVFDAVHDFGAKGNVPNNSWGERSTVSSGRDAGTKGNERANQGLGISSAPRYVVPGTSRQTNERIVTPPARDVGTDGNARANQRPATSTPGDSVVDRRAGQANQRPVITAPPGDRGTRQEGERPAISAVHDVGSSASDQVDDTAAVESAIDVARKAGHGAIAYLPTGRYRISRTLTVTGHDYVVSGSGFSSGLIWSGKPGEPMIEVSGATNVTLANLAVGSSDFGTMNHGDDIFVTSPAGAPSQLVLDGIYAFGKYQFAPDTHGIHFAGLQAGNVVDARFVQGNLRITGCSRARLLFRTTYEGTVTIEGANAEQDGCVGFLTRLTTGAKPALRVRDNQSVVMSDFYTEGSDQIAEISGAAGEISGAVTIQSPKVQMRTNSPIFEVHDYAGRVYYGQSQFYGDPEVTRFRSSGNQPLMLMLAGNIWGNNHPAFDLSPTTKLMLLGNVGAANSSISSTSLAAMSDALDDLRRLGLLDRSLSQTKP